ncbi:hypothetical protein FGG08_004764 [Glutinoglossum americanum]|uniref:Uncharacterized protein n=1 Tax=Glutinoglossum americanum TaxID=1670608 RepID=A0A9P8I8L6_9PEZI|nr:hypothetical protein FGG08_004764 [Glutinoglossum americanum]
MPTAAEFQAFWNERLAQKRTTRPKLGEALNKRWPDKADRMAFYDWSDAIADKRLNEREMTNISPEELTEVLVTMNFNSDIARGKLVNVLERSVVPWLPVGRDRAGTIYRIVPGAYGLLPDQQDPKTDRELVSMNVLGVNTNVQPTIPFRSRKANFSEESTRSNESDDFDYAGFVFHQIGNLEYWADDPDDLRNYEDAANGTWSSTQFHAVMRFGRDGAANGVYVIYDFYPEDEYLEERRKTVRKDWGYLPSDLSNQRITLAKIANQITDLRFGRTFDFAEALDYPVELVRAVKTPWDTIIRATVA